MAMKDEGLRAEKLGGIRRLAEDTLSALLAPVHGLEVALASPAAGSQQEWREHVHEEIVRLIAVWQRHCSLSEQRGGLVYEVEAARGHSRAVTDVINAHTEILDVARSMLTELKDEEEPESPFSRLRREGIGLMASVREHQSKEIELVYETLWREAGGEA